MRYPSWLYAIIVAAFLLLVGLGSIAVGGQLFQKTYGPFAPPIVVCNCIGGQTHPQCVTIDPDPVFTTVCYYTDAMLLAQMEVSDTNEWSIASHLFFNDDCKQNDITVTSMYQQAETGPTPDGPWTNSGSWTYPSPQSMLVTFGPGSSYSHSVGWPSGSCKLLPQPSPTKPIVRVAFHYSYFDCSDGVPPLTSDIDCIRLWRIKWMIFNTSAQSWMN